MCSSGAHYMDEYYFQEEKIEKKFLKKSKEKNRNEKIILLPSIKNEC